MGSTAFGMAFRFFFFNFIVKRLLGTGSAAGKRKGRVQKMQFPGLFCVLFGPGQIVSYSFVPVLSSRTGRTYVKAIINRL
jgi:hypothetical protein